YHLYPPSPPHRASLAPSAGAGGGFLGPAASPSLPSSFLQSSGSSADSVLSLHNHLLERSHHHCNGGGGGMNGSAHDQHDYFDHFPSAMQATNSLRPLPGTESCTQEVGGAGGAAAMAGGRVGRYTAEERKERIERYRSKRNHRNFQKKITYACRKTLADSRPRVRGRFARNGEAEPEPEAEAGEVSSCNNSSSQSGGEYCFGWRPAADDEDEYGGDPDFWDNFLDTMSMNNPMIYS
ncbi:hypothetical protein Taro_026346, partial [Colocasia esculenta]|nr:hypothetical protein [Colocasia esculenta]